jgi:hypothetical protein
VKQHVSIAHGSGELICPHCGDHHLHHGLVSVYARREDESQIVLTEVDGKRTETSVIPSHLTTNPSHRRDGIAIQFRCENCNHAFEITFAQHKGLTLVAWR